MARQGWRCGEPGGAASPRYDDASGAPLVVTAATRVIEPTPSRPSVARPAILSAPTLDDAGRSARRDTGHQRARAAARVRLRGDARLRRILLVSTVRRARSWLKPWPHRTDYAPACLRVEEHVRRLVRRVDELKVFGRAPSPGGRVARTPCSRSGCSPDGTCVVTTSHRPTPNDTSCVATVGAAGTNAFRDSSSGSTTLRSPHVADTLGRDGSASGQRPRGPALQRRPSLHRHAPQLHRATARRGRKRWLTAPRG